MKYLYFVVCCAIACSKVDQVVPTDFVRYFIYYSGGEQSQSPVFSWFAIDSTQTAHPGISLDLSDDQNVIINLPFTFRFYGIDYTEISVSSNGFVAMGSETDYDYTNSYIPDADGPEGMIAGLWDDLDPGNTNQPGDIYYFNDTTNHRFIIEYFQVEHYPNGSHETYEIILYDPMHWSTPTSDGEIVIQYLHAIQQYDITIGIEDEAETLGVWYYADTCYHPLVIPITDSFAMKFTSYEPDEK